MARLYNVKNFKHDPFLTKEAHKYGFAQSEFIWRGVCPAVSVPRKSMPYPVYIARDNMRPHPVERLRDTGFNMPEFLKRNSDEIRFECKNQHIGAGVSPDEMKDWETSTGIEPVMDAMRETQYQYELYQEGIVASLLTDTANYTTGYHETLAGADVWTDPASDPVGKVLSSIQFLRDQGIPPNGIVLSAAVLNALQVHPDIKDRIKYTKEGAMIKASEFAALFGLTKVFVGQATFMSSARGAAEVVTRYWDDETVIGYFPDTNADGFTTREARAIAKTFVWRGPSVIREKVPMNEGIAVMNRWSSDTKPVIVSDTVNLLIRGGFLLDNCV